MANELTSAGLPHLSQSLVLLLGGPAASVYAADADTGEGPLRIATPPPPRPSPEHQAEARKALTGYIALQEPSPRAIIHWLGDLNATVANPVGGEMLEPKMRALGGLLSEYPASVFTVETQRDAVRTFNFFPSGKELADFFDRHLSKIRTVEAGLRRIAAYEEAQPLDVPRPTQAEIDAVANKLRVHRAEMSALRVPERAEARAPLPDVSLSREDRLKLYDKLAKDGDKLAGDMAAAMRQAIALEAQVAALAPAPAIPLPDQSASA